MKQIFSVILALLIVKVLQKFLVNNIIEHGPNSNNIRKKVYKYSDKYYQYRPKVCICPTSKMSSKKV